ncbi:P-loop containing nucleoside triphosphate hydrolase protein [Schizopora paradoxa]|uniref:p-loop containing nucleoside triphosphate hydrolase protein n=1 Tax=Schizopora paradoxa TaxID=27342 RepID=A0A0H2S1H7_9AGAM|nr:P-loop containing nucleoside triphosphate hydrolase protein [Schizopora paradoxa]
MSSFIPQLSSLAALHFQSFNMSGVMANGTTVESDSLFAAMYNFYSFLLTSPAFRDGARLFLLGGSIESARRLLNFAWAHFIESFFLTAEFEERDESFTWIMFWLSKQPSWNSSRNIRVSTLRYGQSGVADAVPGEEEYGKPVDPKRRLTYMPTHNRTQYMWFQGSWLSVTRTQTQGDAWNRTGDERLTITMFTRKLSKFDELLLEAKRAFKDDAEGRINIFVADTYNDWSLAGSRPKRPLSSVVLDKGIKERLLADAKEFMDNEKWYAERGIPWRRGYLLHGFPGTGKTSLIHALAGELNLDIYVVSLSKRGLDDSSLNELISKLPSRSLALMEDIDAAFFRGLTRENDALNLPGQPPGMKLPPGACPPAPSTGVTLSGLLGAIDGVAAQEGRLLFATTNKYSALDPALTRPGRLDVHVRFDYAGKWQVEELFRCFFPPRQAPDDRSDTSSCSSTVVAEDEPDRKSDEALSPPDSPVSLQHDENRSPSSDNDNDEQLDKYHSAIFTVDSGSHCPALTRDGVDELARKFAEHIPDREFSMAAIQGLLMQYKTRPFGAIQDADEWVVEERKKKQAAEGKADDKKAEEEVKEVPESKETAAKVELNDKEMFSIPSSWFGSIAMI